MHSSVTTQTAANNAYVVMPTLPGNVPERLGEEWFADEEKAKHTYRDGDGKGSLKDLVVGKHGTAYPRQTGGLWNPQEGLGRGLRRP